VDRFIEQADTFHPTIKFTADVSENEITFLDTVVFKGERFIEKFILEIKTHNKPMETFQYTHFSSCHPGVKTGFIKGEAYKLFENNILKGACKLQTTLRTMRVSKEIYSNTFQRGYRLTSQSVYMLRG